MVYILIIVSGFISTGNNSVRYSNCIVLNEGINKIEFEFNTCGLYLDSLEIERSIYTIPRIPGVVNTLRKGYPAIPVISESFIVPDDREMNIRIIDRDTIRIKAPPPVPSKGNITRNILPSSVPYTFSDLYSSGKRYPEYSVNISKPFILRDYRGITVYFYPVRYNMADGVYEITTKLKAELHSTGSAEYNIKKAGIRKDSESFNGIYREIFENYREERFVKSRYDTLDEPADRMIIICADEYVGEIDSLVEWKRKKGIKTNLYPLSSIGNNEISIKNFIQSQYDSNGITFCLLVGDGNELVPASGTMGSATGNDADPVYSYTEGDDNYPDIFVSRFSSDGGSEINIRNQVMRTIKYERNPIAGENWYQRGLGVASNLTETGDTIRDFDRCNWLRDTLLYDIQPYFTYTSIDSSYDPWGSSSIISNIINNGVSTINYIGHGSIYGWSNGGGFNKSNINNLTNFWKLPHVISVACVVGNFNGYNCFCETSLDAGTPDNPTGFITNWGSTINQTWVPPTVGQEGAVNILAHYRRNTAGGVYYNGASYMIEQYGGSDSTAGVEMAQTWHIFGDASIQLRTDMADSIVVFTTDFHTDSTGINVNVFESNGITPVENALVSLYFPEDSILVSDYTDQSGHVYLPVSVNPYYAGDYLPITVSGFNYIPYMDSIEIKGFSKPDIPDICGIFNYAKTYMRNPYLSFSSKGDSIYPLHYCIYWDTEYGFPSPDSAVTGTYPSGDTAEYTFTSPLQQGETYFWKVRARDPDGSGYWSLPSEIRSFTVDTTLPGNTVSWYQRRGEQFSDNSLYGLEVRGDSVVLIEGGVGRDTLLTEGFESSFPPSGWNVLNTGTSSSQWTRKSDYSHSGSYSAGIDYDFTYLVDSWLVSEAIDLSSFPSCTLSYWGRYYFDSYYEYHGLWASTSSQSDTSTFIEVQEMTPGVEDIWEERLVDLSSFGGEDTVYVAFRYRETNGTDWWVDDVNILISDQSATDSGRVVSTPICYEWLRKGYDRLNEGWGDIYWEKSDSTDSIGISIEYREGGIWIAVPDSIINGNESGIFTGSSTGTLSISHLDTLVYDTLRLVGKIYAPVSRASTHPALLSWEVGNLSAYSGAGDISSGPVRYSLSPISPNPFRGSGLISYTVPEKAEVSISVYDIMGRNVSDLIKKVHEPGYYSLRWNGRGRRESNLSSGVYFIRMNAENTTLTTKAIKLR